MTAAAMGRGQSKASLNILWAAKTKALETQLKNYCEASMTDHATIRELNADLIAANHDLFTAWEALRISETRNEALELENERLTLLTMAGNGGAV